MNKANKAPDPNHQPLTHDNDRTPIWKKAAVVGSVAIAAALTACTHENAQDKPAVIEVGVFADPHDAPVQLGEAMFNNHRGTESDAGIVDGYGTRVSAEIIPQIDPDNPNAPQEGRCTSEVRVYSEPQYATVNVGTECTQEGGFTQKVLATFKSSDPSVVAELEDATPALGVLGILEEHGVARTSVLAVMNSGDYTSTYMKVGEGAPIYTLGGGINTDLVAADQFYAAHANDLRSAVNATQPS